MTFKTVVWGLFAVMVAVIAQTTLFARLDEFGIVADVVLVVVVIAARWVDPEPALLMGFTGGIIFDLVRTTPIGLRALTYTLVAYGATRFFSTSEGTHLTSAVAVSILSFLGVALFTVVGTLFGQRLFEGIDVVQTFIVLPLINGVLALVIGPVVRRFMAPTKPALL